MNLDTLNKDYFRALFIGSGDSGKTYYICNRVIPTLCNKYQVFIIISPGYNYHVYKNSIPKDKLVISIDSTKFTNKNGLQEQLNNIIFTIDKTQKKGVKDQLGHSIYKYNTCIILDDVLSESLSKSEVMMNMFMRIRHYQCSLIMTANSTRRIITPQMLNNTNYLFVFKLMGKARNDMLNTLMHYVDIKGNDKDINKCFDKLLEDKVDSVKYGHLVIDQIDSKIY